MADAYLTRLAAWSADLRRRLARVDRYHRRHGRLSRRAARELARVRAGITALADQTAAHLAALAARQTAPAVGRVEVVRRPPARPADA